MRPSRIGGVLLWVLTALLVSAHAQTSIQYIYDELGRLISVIDPAGDTAVYHYDAVGNVLSIDRHGSSQVSITWFSPASAATGTTVTISGTGFSSTANLNTVTFNGTAATVSSATATQLVVTVPSGATTGTIGVTAPAGSASSATAFTVAASSAPSITGFSPTIGPVGMAVGITGTNFDPAPANDNLRVHLTHAFVTTASGTALTATIPTATTTGRLRVTTPLGTTLSASDFFIPPSPYAASDVVATARVTPTETLTVSVPTANKVALIAFDGLVNQRITLNITSSSVPSYFVFYRPDGSQLSSDYRGGTTGFIDVKTLSLNGTYVLMVDPNSTSTGSATMTLWDVPADWSGAIVPGGNAVTVTTMAPGQNARLSFDATANQRVSVQITGGNLPAYYVFYKPDGTQLSSNYWNGGAGGFIDTQTLPATGTYGLVVDGNAAATGTTTVKLNDVPADFSGTITADGQPSTATTTVPGQNAGLTFTGTANQRVSIQITNSSLPGYYQLYKPDGSQLSSDYRGSTGFIDVKTLPTSGTYTLKVDGSGSAVGSTTLKLYTVIDGSGSVDIGGSAQTVSITTPGQNATYTMAGTAGQSATVHVTGNAMAAVTVTLKKPDGTTLTSLSSAAGSFNLTTQTLPVTGTYTIVVDPSGANTGSLSLSVTSP